MMPHPVPRAQGAGRTNDRVDRDFAAPYSARMRAALVFALALGLTGCAATRGKERAVPIPLADHHERALGSRLGARFEADVKPMSDPVVNDYVNQLSQRIARLSDRPEIPFAVRIYSSAEPRALAFPGGRLYLSTGLLQRIDTESQLAGVLAHEVAHVVARNPSSLLERKLDDAELAAILQGPPGVDTTAAGAKAMALLLAGFERQAEQAADRAALLYAARVGVNPEGSIQVMEKLKGVSGSNETFWEPLSGGHPNPADRIAEAKSELKAMGLDAGLPNDLHPYAAIKKRVQ